MEKNLEDYILLKTDEKHCIWMSAGVISFKLCPFDYDCEHCDFDTVIRYRKDKNPNSSSDPIATS